MIKQLFSQDLMRHLLENYGRIPSASVFARDFNLRVDSDKAISQETARRWIRGISIPDYNRLKVLVQWLNLEINELSPTNPPMSEKDGSMRSDTTMNKGRRINDVEYCLIEVFRETDLRGKKILLATANSILPGKIPLSTL